MNNTDKPVDSEQKTKVAVPTDAPNFEPQLGKPHPVAMKRETVSPTGFFSGFKVQLPEYELVTPQTLGQYTVRSMTVSEEEALKSSLVTPRKLPEHLNEAIWNCLVKKPKGMDTYNDFLDNVTLKDRDALLYALFHITYKDVSNYDITCSDSTCKAKYPIKFNLSDMFSMDAYPGEPFEILKKTIEVPLDHVEGATAIVKQPTLRSEVELLNDMLFQTEKNLELGTEMSIISHYTQAESNSKTSAVIQGKDNLLRAYNTLQARDRKKINRAYQDEFGKYSIKILVTSQCSKCGASNEVNLDLVHEFFRSIFE